MESVAVLLTCHNRRIKTLACLDALFATHFPDGFSLHVILVDDGSTDGTPSEVRLRFPMVEIINGDGNLYWNRGMHFAYARAMEIGFDAYLWLNDDTLLYPDAVRYLFATAERLSRMEGKESIVVGTTQSEAGGPATYGGVRRARGWRPLKFTLVQPGRNAIRCDTMNGNCVYIPHEVAATVGNLDPKFSHALGDMDYGLRSRKAGFGIWVAPGFIGTCARNSVIGTFMDRSLTARQRWEKMMQPKGLPPATWRVFTRRHAGPLWPLFYLLPYLSVWLPRRRHGKH